MTPGASADPPEKNLSGFDDRLRYVSTALFAAGMLAILLVANTGVVGPEDVNRAALNWVVAAAGASILIVLLFPWRRYGRNLFLAAVVDGLGLVAFTIYFSGGWESPFFPFYFFVVVFSALYFPPGVAAPTVLLAVLVSCSPQLYAPDAALLAEHLMVWVPSYLAVALVSFYMAREVGRRERLRGEYQRRLEEMRRLKERFQREAATDGLTDLPNRFGFDARLREEVEGSRREGRRLALIFLDLDDFKRINDAHGHRAGDEALKLVADVLRLNAREADAVARYGGEEFTVLLPGTALSGAQDFFERIREETAYHGEQRLGFALRLSGGVAIFPRDAADAEGLVEAADLAMYRAKRQGKDRLSHPSLGTG